MNSHANLIDLFSGTLNPKLFMDFDGTISEVDVIDAILENFADERWLETESEWVAGRIGSRECLRKQFSYVKATPGQLFELIDSLNIADGFRSIIGFCGESNLSLNIVSDGFEEYIRRMLLRYLPDPRDMARVTISANSLIPKDIDQWETAFPYFDEVCVDGCATCKPAVMQLHNPLSANTIFVGDGLSDRFAAMTANVVFAKSKLADFCHQNSIPSTTYRTLTQVAKSLDEASEAISVTLPGRLIAMSEAI